MTTHTHTHPHGHAHADGHTHGTVGEQVATGERRLPPSGQGTVMLDIGGDVGALVVHTTEALSGVEIEIARRGESAAFTHTEVRERRLPEGSVYAGVFPALTIGDYTLLGLDGAADHDVTIASGHVTEVTL